MTDSLDELIMAELITPQMALDVLRQFDKSITEALSSKIRNKAVIRGHLKTYRYCDEVWTFQLENGSIRTDSDTIQADRIKIIACNAK